MIKHRPITCNDVLEHLTSTDHCGGAVDSQASTVADRIEQHLVDCAECRDFARATRRAIGALCDVSVELTSQVRASAEGFPRELTCNDRLSLSESPVWHQATKLESHGEAKSPWRQQLMPAAWFFSSFRPSSWKREFGFGQTVAMLLFCLALSWAVAMMLQPNQVPLQVAKRVDEQVRRPTSEGVPSEAGKSWLLETGMTLACFDLDNESVPGSAQALITESNRADAADLSEGGESSRRLQEWPHSSATSSNDLCCSDCHHAKSSVVRTTTAHLAALIGQTCVVCHTSPSTGGSVSMIE